MMQFKPICEVKLMHEYFLTRSDGTSPFKRITQEERLNLLEATFRDSASVDRDLKFELQSDGHSYAGQFKLVPSYSGFRILVKTKQTTLADNSIVYEPALTMPSDLDLFVMIYKNDNF